MNKMNHFDLNQNNYDLIKFQIAQKTQYNIPFYATRELAQSTITGMDHFPYKYFYRGEYNSSDPVVIEREAGYRPHHDMCYMEVGNPTPCKKNFCWQKPCSTVSPCVPDEPLMKKQYDQGQEQCNNKCNIQDRYVPMAP